MTGLFPVLWVDGTPIHESLAICEWAAEVYPNAGLLRDRLSAFDEGGDFVGSRCGVRFSEFDDPPQEIRLKHQHAEYISAALFAGAQPACQEAEESRELRLVVPGEVTELDRRSQDQKPDRPEVFPCLFSTRLEQPVDALQPECVLVEEIEKDRIEEYTENLRGRGIGGRRKGIGEPAEDFCASRNRNDLAGPQVNCGGQRGMEAHAPVPEPLLIDLDRWK